MNDKILEAYIQLTFGKKIKTKFGVYGYDDINNGKNVSYEDFLKFLSQIRNEENQRTLFNCSIE